MVLSNTDWLSREHEEAVKMPSACPAAEGGMLSVSGLQKTDSTWCFSFGKI